MFSLFSQLYLIVPVNSAADVRDSQSLISTSVDIDFCLFVIWSHFTLRYIALVFHHNHLLH